MSAELIYRSPRLPAGPCPKCGEATEGYAVATAVEMKNSQAVADLIRPFISLTREAFFVATFDVKFRPLSIHRTAEGTLASAQVQMRETFRAAILENAFQVVVAHNHPTGDCDPSQQDDRLTERIVAAGAVLGINVVDHLIVGLTTHYSYADQHRIRVIGIKWGFE